MARVGRGTVWLAAALVAGCASARNYPDADSPRFEGRHAEAGLEAGIPASLKVVTFNVKFSRKVDRALQVLRDDPVLRDADIVALQEMNEEAAATIARGLRLNYVYFPGAWHPKAAGNFGNALLSRWPLEDARKVILPHPGRFRKMNRLAVGATLRAGRLRVRAYSVHLETPFAVSDAQRRAQMAAVLEDARDARHVVIAGDFNNRDVAGRFLTAHGFLWLSRPVRSTIGSWAWDHIFVRGFSAREHWARAARNGGASDHRPVWAEVVPDPPLDLSAAP
jgi:endonuclease/exonuclease/phosphatase family metal-dependent hydrolase